MKLHLLPRTSPDGGIVRATTNRHAHFLKVWHYHPELELVHIKSSEGTRFIGDSIEKFEPGETLLIGKNLPHMWLNDERYFQPESPLTAEAIAVHFQEDFLGANVMGSPEIQGISQLFQRARQGIRFDNLDSEIIERIEGLAGKSGFEKILEFLHILHGLSGNRSYRLLASQGFVNPFQVREDKQLEKVHAYIFKHFNTPLNSSEVAQVIHMNPSAFCRYFKRVHRKTFTRYLNELRIGYACKLLLEQRETVTAICYDSGFNNISNFNRQFRTIKGMSPTEYIALHRSD